MTSRPPELMRPSCCVRRPSRCSIGRRASSTLRCGTIRGCDRVLSIAARPHYAWHSRRSSLTAGAVLVGLLCSCRERVNRNVADESCISSVGPLALVFWGAAVTISVRREAFDRLVCQAIGMVLDARRTSAARLSRGVTSAASRGSRRSWVQRSGQARCCVPGPLPSTHSGRIRSRSRCYETPRVEIRLPSVPPPNSAFSPPPTASMSSNFRCSRVARPVSAPRGVVALAALASARAVIAWSHHGDAQRPFAPAIPGSTHGSTSVAGSTPATARIAYGAEWLADTRYRRVDAQPRCGGAAIRLCSTGVNSLQRTPLTRLIGPRSHGRPHDAGNERGGGVPTACIAASGSATGADVDDPPRGRCLLLSSLWAVALGPDLDRA